MAITKHLWNLFKEKNNKATHLNVRQTEIHLLTVYIQLIQQLVSTHVQDNQTFLWGPAVNYRENIRI